MVVARWRYFVITFCPTRLSTAFLLDSLSFLVGRTSKQRSNHSSIPSILSRFIVLPLPLCFPRLPLWIFFVHRRPIRIPKSLPVQMHNSRLCIPRNYCLSRLINADRFGAAILLAVSGYVREIRRVNSPMDGIYSCTQSCVTSWCKRQGSLKATLTEIYTGLRFIREKERQSVITWDGILRRRIIRVECADLENCEKECLWKGKYVSR